MKLETKLKHTRGSWKPLYVTNAMDGTLSDKYDVDVYGGDQPNGVDLLVAKLPIKDQNDILICEDEVRANARLIAAAPDLLDALMKATLVLHSAFEKSMPLQTPYMKQFAEETPAEMRAALTKANGENQE